MPEPVQELGDDRAPDPEPFGTRRDGDAVDAPGTPAPVGAHERDRPTDHAPGRVAFILGDEHDRARAEAFFGRERLGLDPGDRGKSREDNEKNNGPVFTGPLFDCL